MATVIVAIIVFGIVGIDVAKLVYDKVHHKGGCSCGCDCSHCSSGCCSQK